MKNTIRKGTGLIMAGLLFSVTFLLAACGGGDQNTAIAISVEGDIGTVYSGQSYQFPTESITFKNENTNEAVSDVDYSITYTQGEEVLSAAPVNAGAYGYIISVNDSRFTAENHVGTFTIAKQTLTIGLANQFIRFDDVKDEKFYTPEYTIQKGDVHFYVRHQVTFDGNEEKPRETGVYNVNVKILDAVINYQGEASAMMTIYDDYPMFDKGLSTVYDGNAYELDIITTYEVRSKTITYDGLAEAPTNAGNYHVIANLELYSDEIEEEFNYKLERTLTIQKRDINNLSDMGLSEITVDNLTYTGEVQEFVFSNVPEGISYTTVVTDIYGRTGSHKWAGEYSGKITVSENEANFEGEKDFNFEMNISFATALEAYSYGKNYFENGAADYYSIANAQIAASGSNTYSFTERIKSSQPGSTAGFYIVSGNAGAVINIIIAKVDARMGLEAYVDKSTGEWNWRGDFKDKSGSPSAKPAAWPSTFSISSNSPVSPWTDTSKLGSLKKGSQADYLDEWKIVQSNLSNYNVATETISSGNTAISLNGNNQYELNFTFNSGVHTQMHKDQINKFAQGTGAKYKSFTSLPIKYILDRFGRIVKVESVDTYKVNMLIDTTTTVSNFEVITYGTKHVLGPNGIIA